MQWHGLILVIRPAVHSDLSAIALIADRNKETLGFVMRATLSEAILHCWLMVAEQEGAIVGFCNYRHCRDGHTTIYELCVTSDVREKGIGRALVQVVLRESRRRGQTHIRLKCVIENKANDFYEHIGFVCIGVEQGKKRALKVWKYDLIESLW